MNRHRVPAFHLLIILLTGLGLIASTHLNASLRAGAAAVDITPRLWPVYLRGSFFVKPAESAHDPLHARALVLEDGRAKMALVIIDSCMVRRENLDQAKAIASEATGIPVNRMLCAATHTHSAPYDFARYGTEPEKAYVTQLIKGIAESVIQADANLQAAELGYGSTMESSEVFNRRWFLDPADMPLNPFGEKDLVKMNPGRGNPDLQHPAGPVDPEVYVLSVRTAEGRPLALLGNYSLHYVGKTPVGQVSADYFGEFARLVGNRLEEDKPIPEFVGILSNGTSADINNIPFHDPRPNREPFEQIRLVAAKVADAAYRAYASIEHRSDLPLAMAEREITLDRRIPSRQQVKEAEALLEKLKGVDGESQFPRNARSYAERILAFAKTCEESPTVDILVQTLRIGDLAVCSSPFETFAETGLRLKRRSPFPHTFTIELANGAEGYLPTPAQHHLGGYETWLTTNKVEFGASEKLVRQLLEMLEELQAHD